MADAELDAVRVAVKHYRSTLEQSVRSAPNEVTIDDDSVTLFVHTNTLVVELDRQIALASGHPYDEGGMTGADGQLAAFVSAVGITNLGDLERSLHGERGLIVEIGRRWVLGVTSPGFSVLVFCHALAARMWGEAGLVRLVKAVLGDDTELDIEDFAKRLYAVYVAACNARGW